MSTTGIPGAEEFNTELEFFSSLRSFIGRNYASISTYIGVVSFGDLGRVHC